MAFFLTTISLSRSLRFTTTKHYYYASPLPSILTNSPTKAFVSRRRLTSSAMASDNESPSKNPGLRSDPPDEETKGYFMQQTMYRIKDPKVSLKFYSDVLGMSLLKRLDFPDMKFSLYFLGYEDTSSAPKDPVERTEWTFGKLATIELTHNWGTEDDPKFEGYHNGNSDPRGFGHIGITVDDTYKACKRFESLNVPFVKKPDEGNFSYLVNVPFVKKPDEGKMTGIAFIKDPDGYWIEIFDRKNITNVAMAAAPKPE